MVKANHALINSAPGGRKNILNEYTTKLINPQPHPPPPRPTLPHEIRNLEGFLSI